jgi:sugar/nucleoside kinase (ribokinase family)
MERQAIADVIRADLVLFDGYNPSVVAKLKEIAKAQHVETMIDAGDWRECMDESLEGIDIVKASHEFRPNGKEATTKEILEYLKTKNAKNIVITRGHLSTIFKRENHMAKELPVKTVTQVVDTHAAGDISNAGLALGYVESDGDLEEAVRFNNAIGGLKVETRGPREFHNNILSYQDMLELIGDSKLFYG